MLPLSWIKSLASTCTSLGLPLHCDGEDDGDRDDHGGDDHGGDDHGGDAHDDECSGARLLHSSTALGIGPDQLLEGVHSSTLCLRWITMMMISIVMMLKLRFWGLVSVLNVMLISLQQRPWSAHWLLGGGEVTSIVVSSQYSIIIITFISSYQYHDHTARR